MGQVHPLPQADSPEVTLAGPAATVRSIDSAHCGLCGSPLGSRALRYHVVSPQSCESPLTVCHTCHRAALGEGYRPAQ
jgi:hypothetical protein